MIKGILVSQFMTPLSEENGSNQRVPKQSTIEKISIFYVFLGLHLIIYQKFLAKIYLFCIN